MDQSNIGSGFGVRGSGLKIVVGIALSVAVVAGVGWLLPQVFAQTQTQAGDAATSDHTVTTDELAKIERSLDDVLASQQQVLQKFDGIAEELRIIKVRATSRGALSK